ncbi:type VII secretion system-associated protein [Parasphingorhabdus pacifica]
MTTMHDDTPLPTPEITDAMREQARSRPGARVYVMDPEFDANGEVPPWGIRGAFPADPTTGELAHAQWIPNPNYRPGPKLRGWPEPTNAIERALELAASGYSRADGLLRALAAADAHLSVITDMQNPNQIPVVADQDGRPVLHAYTSDNRVPLQVTAGGSRMPVRGLVKVLDAPDMQLALNTDSPPGLVLPGRDIVSAMIAIRRDEAQQ